VVHGRDASIRRPTKGWPDVTDADDRVLERVRKLLARAEHPATPAAEAEACSAKAAALMSRHVIDQAMLDARRPDGSQPVTRQLVVDAPYAVAKAVLLDAVARAFRVCVAITSDADAGDRGARRCTLVGFPADLRMAELLFTSLLLQSSAAMLAATPNGAGVKAFRRAFLFGYAAAIGARLREVRRDTEEQAVAEKPGAELVLVDRHARVERAFAEQFPRLRTLRATVSDRGGVWAGHEAGTHADLSAPQARVGGRRALGA
jgi:hypothetical protein